jgi:hypothetical protein
VAAVKEDSSYSFRICKASTYPDSPRSCRNLASSEALQSKGFLATMRRTSVSRRS